MLIQILSLLAILVHKTGNCPDQASDIPIITKSLYFRYQSRIITFTMSRIPLVTTALVTTLSFCAHYCPRTDYEAVQSWPRPGVSWCWPGLPCTQLHCTQYCTPVLYTVLYTCTTQQCGPSQPPHHQCYISSTYKLLSWSS